MSEEQARYTLADFLVEHGKLPLGEGLALLDALLAAVGESHRRDQADGALHPARVIALGPGKIALMPATDVSPQPDAEQYLSPQQREGKPADVRADVYALGVMAYRMLMGIYPYGSGSDEPADPHEYLPNLVDRVRRSLVIAVQKNLTERFGDALTFRAVLKGESAVALETPTLRWAVAEGIPEGDTGAADEFAGDDALSADDEPAPEVEPQG